MRLVHVAPSGLVLRRKAQHVALIQRQGGAWFCRSWIHKRMCFDDAKRDNEKAASGPVTLWTTLSLTADFEAAQRTVYSSTVVSVGGVGPALLAIAAETPPTYYGIGLLMACLHCHFAGSFLQHSLRTNLRRNVTDVMQESLDSGGIRLRLSCDGGITREFELSVGPAPIGTPSLAQVLAHGWRLVYIDHELGHANEPQMLEAVLRSERAIVSEKVIFATGEDVRGVAKLSAVKGEQLDMIAKTAKAMKVRKPPKLALKHIARFSQFMAGIVFFGGGTLYMVEQEVEREIALRKR